MHQGGRVFGKHLDNQVEKKHGKNKKELEDINGKENLINDAILSKEGFNTYESPQSVSMYQQEIYEFLNSRELNSKEPRFFIDQSKINESVRATTIRFIIKLAKTFTLKMETLFQTVDLMDQTIQILNPTIDELELISLTCLFIASKYEEIYPPPLPILIQGTDITVKEIVNMEKEILHILDFNIISDNTLIWLQLMGELLGCNVKFCENIKQRCLQLAEISLMSSLFLNFRKSTIALCIFLAVEMMMGFTKTQFKWEKLSEHSKPGKDSKPLKLLTYLMKMK